MPCLCELFGKQIPQDIESALNKIRQMLSYELTIDKTVNFWLVLKDTLYK